MHTNTYLGQRQWESGRGYPNLDSLKEISKYFSITIDELLSGDKLISIAEKENQSNIQSIEYYGSNVPLFRRNGYRQSGTMIP